MDYIINHVTVTLPQTTINKGHQGCYLGRHHGVFAHYLNFPKISLNFLLLDVVVLLFGQLLQSMTGE